MYGAVIVPISLFVFAFTTYTNIHWIVSVLATVPFGIGVIWSFQAVFVYLVDAFRPIAASAMAANSALRSTFAAGFPLFTGTLSPSYQAHNALTLNRSANVQNAGDAVRLDAVRISDAAHDTGTVPFAQAWS